MTGTTLFEKIWANHRICALDASTDLVLVDRTLLHERTGGVALRALRERGRSVACPNQVFAVMDHVVDTFPGRSDETVMPTGTDFIRALRTEAKAAGIRLFDIGDPDQGIVHVMSPELAIVLPGLTLVCPDSHTCTQGALGALAWGIGSSEAEHVLATGTIRVKRPATLRMEIQGELAPSVTAKDVALHIIARFGSSFAAGHVIEFCGSAVRSMDVEARMTLCNMATEMAAFSAIIAPDDKTLEYLAGGRYAPVGADWDGAAANWRNLSSDEGASFDVVYEIDARAIEPMVSWGTNPQQSSPLSSGKVGKGPAGDDSAHARALNYMALAEQDGVSGLPISVAFIGSCTNSRLSDLRRAADVLQGRHVAEGVRAICVPGSSRVKRQAEEEGLHLKFLEAGFEWRESGCSMCFFAGGEAMPAGARVISSTNRNFENRQGPGTRTHIASPETVAASAIAGRIATPKDLR